MVSNQSKGIKRILSFAGRYRGLLTFARCLSGISALFIIGPFICVYFAARELIAVFLGDQLNGQALLNWGLFALGLELGFAIFSYRCVPYSKKPADGSIKAPCSYANWLF